MVRRPYRTKMRVWNDPSAPLVDVYWFITTKPFLPFPTVFSSRDWTADPWRYNGLGEAFGHARPYDGLWNIPGLVGDHICGTPEDFLEGPAWPPVGPALEYDADGIPTCCDRLQEPNVCSCAEPNALVTFNPGGTVSSPCCVGLMPLSLTCTFSGGTGAIAVLNGTSITLTYGTVLPTGWYGVFMVGGVAYYIHFTCGLFGWQVGMDRVSPACGGAAFSPFASGSCGVGSTNLTAGPLSLPSGCASIGTIHVTITG